jgi:hypothetical protein
LFNISHLDTWPEHADGDTSVYKSNMTLISPSLPMKKFAGRFSKAKTEEWRKKRTLLAY